MKAYFLIPVILFCSSAAYPQTDTLYMDGGTTFARVVEITGDAVKFIYPDEDFINTVYKNNIQKIAFGSGRVQTFSESNIYKDVRSVGDFDKVMIASVEGEIKGLHKIGNVSATAQGASTVAEQEKVKQRAFRKLKIEAAMMGANVVYLSGPQSQGIVAGSYRNGSSSEASLTGVAYLNEILDYNEFQRVLDDRTQFVTSERSQMRSEAWDYSKRPFMKDLHIREVIDQNGSIIVQADLGREKNKPFRLASFDNDGFNIFYRGKNAVYNVKILF